MPRFYYMSDLHLEFGMGKPMMIEGENLILAGDITVLRCLNPFMTDAGNTKIRDRTHVFFDQMLKNFKNVFYLTGNHESYNFNIDLEAEYIAKYLPGVIHVNNSSHIVDDETVLMGGTLWTDMNKGNSTTMWYVEQGMNDFRIIYKGENKTWTAEDARQKHLQTMEFLTNELKLYKDKKVIVATHHVPSARLVNPNHVRSIELNHGYYTNLEDFILDHPQISHWIAGHTHVQGFFDIGGTKLVSNAKGYEGYEECARTFNPNTHFSI